MKPENLNCPVCKAPLSAKQDEEFATCEYCGSTIRINPSAQRIIFKEIDEARIHEADTKKVVGLKDIETKQLNIVLKTVETVAWLLAVVILILLANIFDKPFYSFLAVVLLIYGLYIYYRRQQNKSNPQLEKLRLQNAKNRRKHVSELMEYIVYLVLALIFFILMVLARP